jgi:hypothetical protein
VAVTIPFLSLLDDLQRFRFRTSLISVFTYKKEAAPTLSANATDAPPKVPLADGLMGLQA